MLWASQVAVGNENNLRLRVYGEKGGLDWSQENPNYLHFSQYGKPTRTLTRNGADATPSAKHASRIPSGHPEGFHEALANLHRSLEWTIRAGRGETVPKAYPHPGIADGVAGMAFIEAAVASSKQDGEWIEVPKIG